MFEKRQQEMTGGLNQTKECGTQKSNETLKEMISGRYST